ncbi:BnaC01g21850D [Brassica napus]|uniref:BnaC01g21850D protein n=1 Tax=Brassica napus TaxID=3708 RepID=A0A078HCE2_BRANA|nr:BnaC01g21850D [Brassica napus]
MTDKRLRAASQLSSKQKTPPSNRRATREREAVEVQAPSDTAETHQFGAETAELPMQEEERVTIAFAESIAQHIEQILELENLEDAEANDESERLLSSQP